MSSIRDSRLARNLNRAFRRLAKIGRHPAFSNVLDYVRKLIGRDKTGSSLEPAKFINGASFPLKEFNKNLEDIYYELELLFDEATYRSSRIVESNVILEENVAELRRQLLKIKESNERELLLAGSNFLDAVVIKFADRTYIDDDTTADVNTKSGIVTLPIRAGARRVIPKIAPQSPTEVATPDNDARVLPGSSFPSLFSDTLVGWQVHTMSNTLRVRTNLRQDMKVSRIELYSPDEQVRVDLRLSSDGINFLRPAPSQVIIGGRATFLIEQQLFKFIEFQLTSRQAPETDGIVFTLDKIAMYDEGYKTDAQITTTAISREDAADIKLARVEIDAEVPPSTWIDVEVAPNGGSFVPVEGSIFNFTDSRREDVRRGITAALVEIYTYSTIRGPRAYTPAGALNTGIGYNDVFGIAEADMFGNKTVPTSYDAKSLRLYRSNNWGIDRSSSIETVHTSNTMLMQQGEKRLLYIPVVDEPHQNGATVSPVITTDRTIMTGASVSLFGSADSQVIKVTGTLDYASMDYSGAAGDPPEFDADITIEGTSPRVVRLVDSNPVVTPIPSYIDDYDNVVIEGVGLVKIVGRDDSGRLLLDPTVDITAGTHSCKLQTRDLTTKIVAISGRNITFSVPLRDYERVLISYMSPLDNVTEQLVGPSVRVVSARDNTVAARAGIDYRVQGGELELLRGNALPNNGDSPPLIPLAIEFDYVRTVSSELSYYTYATVPDGPNRIVKIGTPITLQHDEKVVWTDPAGRAVDMHGLTNMVLAPGLHRFSVIGHRAIDDGGKLDQTTALYKLINLQAEDGGYIFDFNSGYISDMTGYPDPMVPTSRFYLERVAKFGNTTHFAWEDNAILFGFDPSAPEDAVTIEPGNTSVLTRADYILSYRFYSATGATSFQVRVNLHREPGEVESRTPIIRGLTVMFTE